MIRIPKMIIRDTEKTEAYSVGILKLNRRRYARIIATRQISTSKLKIIQEGRLDREYRIIL
ncbi:MAG: hypothetical protein HC831_04020 [Chloroflexia bacterium]|nr:hypothetical protein [Chloroflexia bacterium]